MEMAEIDLAAVVRSAFQITVLSASARGIEVGLHLGLDPAPLHGDHVRLLQVVWNLLSNAIKFTPQGGEINVRLDREDNMARLSVTDNGAGISAAFAPHVFELSRQADETASHLPGLGIGLSIVAQIVKQHGGAVRVESAGVGQGSAFIVTLPLQTAAPLIPSGRRSAKPRRNKSEKAS
jgi:signal transduction histidine kinase